MLLERVEAFARLGVDGAFLGQENPGIALTLGAAHAAA